MCDIKRRKVAKEVVKKLIARGAMMNEDYNFFMNLLDSSTIIELTVFCDKIIEVNYSWKESSTGFGNLTVKNLE